MLGVEVFLNYVSQPIRILREKDEALTGRKMRPLQLRKLQSINMFLWDVEAKDVAGEDIRSPFDLSWRKVGS